jgi:hypothetical protein
LLVPEIGRLQNSLDHLKETQEQLQEALGSPPDSEIAQIVDENAEVMYVRGYYFCCAYTNVDNSSGSQEERINMLRLALSHKGVLPASARHYGLDPPSSNIVSTTAPVQSNQMQVDTVTNDDDEGVYL